MTEQQQRDAKMCEELEEQGRSMDCEGCSCLCCVARQPVTVPPKTQPESPLTMHVWNGSVYVDTGNPWPAPQNMMRWISVDEQLPGVGTCDDWRTHVLLLAGDRALEGYRTKNGNWARANASYLRDLPPVTHWMPMPAPIK